MKTIEISRKEDFRQYMKESHVRYVCGLVTVRDVLIDGDLILKSDIALEASKLETWRRDYRDLTVKGKIQTCFDLRGFRNIEAESICVGGTLKTIDNGSVLSQNIIEIGGNLFSDWDITCTLGNIKVGDRLHSYNKIIAGGNIEAREVCVSSLIESAGTICVDTRISTGMLGVVKSACTIAENITAQYIYEPYTCKNKAAILDQIKNTKKPDFYDCMTKHQLNIHMGHEDFDTISHNAARRHVNNSIAEAERVRGDKGRGSWMGYYNQARLRYCERKGIDFDKVRDVWPPFVTEKAENKPKKKQKYTTVSEHREDHGLIRY